MTSAEMKQQAIEKRALLEEWKVRRSELVAEQDRFTLEFANAQHARGAALLTRDEQGAVRALSDLGFSEQSLQDVALQLKVLNPMLQALAEEVADLERAWRRAAASEAEAVMLELAGPDRDPAGLGYEIERENPYESAQQALAKIRTYRAAVKQANTFGEAATDYERQNPRGLVIEQLLKD